MVNISIITLYIVSFCKNSRGYHYYHAVIFFWIATALKSFVYFQSLVWKNMLLALNRRINDDSLRESYATKQYTVCHILWIVKVNIEFSIRDCFLSCPLPLIDC